MTRPKFNLHWLWIGASVVGALALTLLAVATANSTFFAQYFRWLILLNSVVVLVLLGLVIYQVTQLIKARRANVFGAKLSTRMTGFFVLMALIPGLALYLVSAQFLSASIESWFDVKVNRALDAGLKLGQLSLKRQETDLTLIAQSLRNQLIGQRDLLSDASRLKTAAEQHQLQWLAVIQTLDKRTLVLQAVGDAQYAKADGLPESAMSIIDTLPDGNLLIRAAAPLTDSLQLQIAQVVSKPLRELTEAVDAGYRGYQNIELSRPELTNLYASILTLTLLLALLSAFALAFVLSDYFAKPLSRLAAGTRAVAAGDFTVRQPVETRDELGVLTESFNLMTNQLSDARGLEASARQEIETTNAYLENVLRNLSTGVLVFDAEFKLRVVNAAASVLLQTPLENLRGQSLKQWPALEPQLQGFSDLLTRGMAQSREGQWQRQAEIMIADQARTIISRGSRLPGMTVDGNGGTVLVFDDVTDVLQAQRDVAWSEVARRMAHEVKNPLTPIQLSAERLSRRLTPNLNAADAAILAKATNTIVTQVTAMKNMVDDFSAFARQPKPGSLQPVDTQALLLDVLSLYEAEGKLLIHLDWQADAKLILGDSTRLRQVFHNLLQNALDAVTETAAPFVGIVVVRNAADLFFQFMDSGPGFSDTVRERAFEPYVTTKQKGTGLGLAIVKKIVEEHGGQITLNNRPEGGAVIALHLPLIQENKLN
jgi:nitrogen fixation/metabolism regulation signal transduction histidine kinase